MIVCWPALVAFSRFMKKQILSLIVHDIASNTLGAATTLARAFQGEYDVEIVGPDLGGGISAMYRNAFNFKVVPAPRLYRLPDFLWQVRRLERAVAGDVIFAVKAYADTLPVALRLKARRGAKVVVYLDEWDAANYYMLSCGDRLRRWLRHVHHPLDDIYFPWVERLIPRADRVLCSSTFLKEKFGGIIVPFGVDTDTYKPQPAETVAGLKRSLGLADCRLVVFGGVVRPHKRIETLLDALVLIGNPAVKLLVVGPETEHLASLRAVPKYGTYIACTGARPHDEMPLYLDLADVVVVPQADSLLARSQVPCKVFEAMAMAKPVIAGAVSDLPAILDGCGWTFGAGDAAGLAQLIQHIFGAGGEAAKTGRLAREKCIARYSMVQTGSVLREVVSELVSAEGKTP